ncbi:Adhesion G Protein-Coupled Receptor L3 [Manis pentadactyla]|nr:Adhesion G Protein-Coupled Receptor L3 [Manis pentadactyla]
MFYSLYYQAMENLHAHQLNTYWNQGYSYQQGYGPGYGGSDDLPHGYYGYSPGYYYSTAPDSASCLQMDGGKDSEAKRKKQKEKKQREQRT